MGVSGKFGTGIYTLRLDLFQKYLSILSVLLSDFFDQNVLAPSDQYVLIPPYQNVCIIFVQNIYWEY